MGANIDPLSLATGATTQGLGALIRLIGGGGQRREARKLLRDNPYPDETVPDEIYKNQNIAENNAAVGMPSEQYNQAMRNIQRQQVAALRAAQDRRGGLIALPSILQGTNDATLDLDAKDAEMRREAQKELMSANNNVAEWKDKVWDWNTRQKYLQNYQYAMSLLGAGNQNFTAGLDQGVGALGSLMQLFGNNRNNGSTAAGFAGG